MQGSANLNIMIKAARRAGRSLVKDFREEEGLSAVLPTKAAAGLRPHGPVLRRITLSVHSALDGVGLTAAVAGVLAGAGIACNVIAALHHDHILVPEADAERALAALLALQAAQG